MSICEGVSVRVWESTQNREGKRERDLLEETGSCGRGSPQVCKVAGDPGFGGGGDSRCFSLECEGHLELSSLFRGSLLEPQCF